MVPFKDTTISPVPVTEKTSIYNDGIFASKDYKIHSNVKTTIQNWELRDIVCCADDNTIVHPHQESLCFYRPDNGTKASISLPFSPTTVDSRHGLIAAAGHQGAVTLKSLFNEAWTQTFKSGMGMNNSIRLSGSGQDTRVTVCNNDQTMRVYGLAPDELKNLVTFDLSAAINQATISPDNRSLLTVSDSGHVTLYNTHDYTKMTEFKVSSGAALACAWNGSSNNFAVSSQNGMVHIYDVRQDHQSLAKICSTESRATRNVPRSLQFSKAPLDLLIYAEHVSNINIVDTRSFESRQIVRIGPDDQDTHIAGLAFTQDSRSIFVGTELDMVQININSSARRQFSHFTFTR